VEQCGFSSSDALCLRQRAEVPRENVEMPEI
jgi:hypothetical protein